MGSTGPHGNGGDVDECKKTRAKSMLVQCPPMTSMRTPAFEQTECISLLEDAHQREMGGNLRGCWEGFVSDLNFRGIEVGSGALL